MLRPSVRDADLSPPLQRMSAAYENANTIDAIAPINNHRTISACSDDMWTTCSAGVSSSTDAAKTRYIDSKDAIRR